MLVQRRGRCASINTASGQLRVFAQLERLNGVGLALEKHWDNQSSNGYGLPMNKLLFKIPTCVWLNIFNWN